MASPHEIRAAIADDILMNDDGHVYDAAIYADGVLFTARRPEFSLIVRDESRIEELATITSLIDEMNDEFFSVTERIVETIMGR